MLSRETRKVHLVLGLGPDFIGNRGYGAGHAVHRWASDEAAGGVGLRKEKRKREHALNLFAELR